MKGLDTGANTLRLMKVAFLIIVLGASLTMIGCGGGGWSESGAKQVSDSDDSGDSGTDTGSEGVTNASGRIVGYFEDSNGNPIDGVSVSAAGQIATTDANGYFELANVVASTVNTSQSDLDEPAFVVVFSPPAPYLAGQIVATQASADSGSFDAGFVVDTDVVVLPSQTAGIDGVLCDVETGGPIMGTGVTLTSNDQSEVLGAGLSVSWQTFNYTATTDNTDDNEGTFSFTVLPNNTNFTLGIVGNAWQQPTTVLKTVNAGVADVGRVCVSPAVVVGDSIAPFVKSVNGVADSSADYGVLQRNFDVTTGIVINLSEVVKATAINATTVKVYGEDDQAYLPVSAVALDANKQSVVVTLSSALVDGAKFRIMLPKNDITDLVGNVLAAVGGVQFAEQVTAESIAYVQVNLQMYKDLTPTQGISNLVQLQSDAAGSRFAHLNSTVFSDNSFYGSTITQLNSAKDDDNNGEADAAERLSSLAKAATETGYDVPDAVEVKVARIQFTPVSGWLYEIALTDQAGNARVVSIRTEEGGNNFDEILVNGEEIVRVKVPGSGDASFLLENVEPGWMLKVRALDEHGNGTAWSELSLVDAVPPSTVLQQAYGHCGVNAAGDSGEIVIVNEGGLPKLCVTPLLLAPYSTIAPLPIESSAALNALYYARQSHYLAGSLDPELMGGNDAPYYDAGAYGHWIAQSWSRTVGAAFSENVALTGNPAYDGTQAVLNNFKVYNNVTVNDQNGPVNADLVIFDVDDVMALAFDHGARLNFDGVVQDVAGNTTDAQAQVVIADRIPPLVISAVYDGSTSNRTLSVTFNEPVRMNMGDYLEFEKFNVHVHSPKSGTTLTFNVDEIAGGLAPNFMGVKTYDRGNDRVLAMDFSRVQDQHGNAWRDYADDNNLVPSFLLEGVSAAFMGELPVASNFNAGVNSFTVEYRTNYPVFLEQMLDPSRIYEAPGALNSLTGAQLVAAGFELTGGASIDVSASSATRVGNVLTVTIQTTSNLTAGSTFNAPNFYADTTAFVSLSEPMDPDGSNGIVAP